MKLVTFEDPIWSTLQGEGILAGTPSAFVRMWGCDFSCAWCDTKKSWEPGSTWQEIPVYEVMKRVRETRLTHAVITGGNPLLQVDELCDLLAGLHEPWADPGVKEGSAWRSGFHTTVETQGSMFDEAVIVHADLLSISPKLHDWREPETWLWVKESLRREKEVQVKIVVQNEQDVSDAVDALSWYSRESKRDPLLHLILQPEYSGGRRGVEEVHSALVKQIQKAPTALPLPRIRVLPQLHKSSLYVR